MSKNNGAALPAPALSQLAAAQSPSPPPLAYTVPEAVATTKIGRSLLYEEIKAGRLSVIKIGRRTLIRHEALSDWLMRAERESSAAEAGRP